MRILTKNKIHEAIRRCNPNKIAVAYIGADWNQYIQSPDALEAVIISPTFGTNPWAVRGLVKAIGWKKIFFLNELHAKLYLGRNSAVTGSANLTNNGLSGEKLVELCVEISDKDVVTEMVEIFDAIKNKAVKQYSDTQQKESKLIELEKVWCSAIANKIIPPVKTPDNKFVNFILPSNDYFYVSWCHGKASEHSDEVKKIEGKIKNEITFYKSEDIKLNKWILAWNMKKNETPSKNIHLHWIYIHDVYERGAEGENYSKLIIQRNDKELPPHPFEITDEVTAVFKEVVVDPDIKKYLIQTYSGFRLNKSIKGVPRGCPEFCVNGISLLLRHPVFKLDSKPI